MNERDRTGDAGPLQTIEAIEARAAEIVERERVAMLNIAAFFRETAVELPPESRMPVRLANAARTLDSFARGSEPALWGCLTFDKVVEAYSNELLEMIRLGLGLEA